MYVRRMRMRGVRMSGRGSEVKVVGERRAMSWEVGSRFS